MHVIGVGFGRTGTASLKVALERLGVGPCYHMFNVIAEPTRARAWLAAARGERPDWDEIFAGFGSTVDWPAAAFWRELVDAYPDAKVILTVRDPDRWYTSATETIFRMARRSQSPVGRQLLRLIALTNPGFGDFVAMTDAVVVQRVFGGHVDDRDHAVAVFSSHTAEVRAGVPPDRLLELDIAEGWRPLCELLDLPVPDEPFPHLNDAAEFQRRQAARMRRLLLPVAAAGAAALAVAAAVVIRRGRRSARR
jgi:hypothetical protein